MARPSGSGRSWMSSVLNDALNDSEDDDEGEMSEDLMSEDHFVDDDGHDQVWSEDDRRSFMMFMNLMEAGTVVPQKNNKGPSLRRPDQHKKPDVGAEIPEEFRKCKLVAAHNAVLMQFSLLGSSRTLLSAGTLDQGRSLRPGGWPALSKLQPIAIGDLTEGRCHEGRVLYGTVCVEPFQMSGIMSVLEDQAGFAARISVYNVKLSTFKEKFSQGMKIAIREPYLKRGVDGLLFVRVDDPSSMEKISTIPKNVSASAADSKFGALNSLKLRGNRLFVRKDWKGAMDLYTECIKGCASVADPKLIMNVLLPALSNRAEAWLKIFDYESALVDANKALKIDASHLKSMFRKGRALDGLQEFERASYWLQKAYDQSAGNSDIQASLVKSKVCDQQAKTGVYDISSYLKQQGPPPDCSDYVGPVVIRKVSGSGGGWGLFVTKDVKVGELLVVNNAVALASGMEQSLHFAFLTMPMNTSKDDLINPVLSKLASSRRALSQFKLLAAPAGRELDDEAMDVFRANNGLVPEDLSDVNLGDRAPRFDRKAVTKVIEKHGFDIRMPFIIFDCGLWVLPSFIRHSCLSNTSLIQVGAAMFVHAARDIKAGEELTTTYFEALVPLRRRQEQCSIWGFTCHCKRCVLERSLRKQLRQLNEAFEPLFSRAGQRGTMEDCGEFAELGVRMEKKLQSIEHLSKEERCWVRASYVSAYLAGMQSVKFLSSCTTRLPCVEEIVEVMQSTVPGNLRAVALLAHKVAALMRFGRGVNDGNGLGLVDQGRVMEVCKSLFGNQEPEVVKELVVMCSKLTLF